MRSKNDRPNDPNLLECWKLQHDPLSATPQVNIHTYITPGHSTAALGPSTNNSARRVGASNTSNTIPDTENPFLRGDPAEIAAATILGGTDPAARRLRAKKRDAA